MNYTELWNKFVTEGHRVFDNLLELVVDKEQLLLVWPIWVVVAWVICAVVTPGRDRAKLTINGLLYLEYDQIKLFLGSLFTLAVKLAVFASYLALSWFSCYASRVH